VVNAGGMYAWEIGQMVRNCVSRSSVTRAAVRFAPTPYTIRPVSESVAEPDRPKSIVRPTHRILTVFSVALVVLATASCTDHSDLGSSSRSAPSSTDAATAPGPASTNPITTEATTTTAAPTTTSTTTTTTTTTTTLPPTTTTPLVTQGAVVLIANASAVPGAAGRLTETLRAAGFQVADPTNAAGWEESLDASKIYARPEAQAVADSLSQVMGGIPVSGMPTPAPIVGAMVGLGDAGVLLMLGKDLADVPPPGLAG
jgi:LytR cell envelope-related transcriptional attenuator